MIAEHRAQEIDQSKTEIGVKDPVDGGSRRVLNHPMDQPGLPARLRNSIAVDRRHGAAPDLERGPVGAEGQPQIPFPEVAIPPIMVSADHHDGQPPPEPGQRRRDMEATPRDHSRVGEPEVKQIAVDEQAIAQRRHGIEELEKCLLYSGRCHSEVGIGHDHEGAAEHGAKDGVPFPLVQLERTSRVRSTLPNV